LKVHKDTELHLEDDYEHLAVKLGTGDVPTPSSFYGRVNVVDLEGSGYKFTDEYVRTLSGELDRELAEWAGVTSDDLDACERGMRLAIQESTALVSHRAKRRKDVLSEEGVLSLSLLVYPHYIDA
jgi:hypothetical protein